MNHILDILFHLPIALFKLFKLAANKESYYPELPHKSYWEKLCDLFKWFFKYHEVNKFYYLYGFDVSCPKKNMDQYMDYKSFMTDRARGNKLGRPDSQIVVLRDKYLFYRYMKSISLPVPEIFAVMNDGVLYDNNMNCVDESFLFGRYNYFIKETCGECASFVKRVGDYAVFKDMRPSLHGRLIFQDAVKQCSAMNVLNGKSINTLRIITINRNGKTYPLTALLRVGTEKTGNVDNWAAGGLAIGINKDGTLKERGFYKPVHGTCRRDHPDSRIVFSEFKVPYYQEAIQVACRAHQFFPNIRSIGWDVAIQEDGPVFIEGNDNWEISLQQACDRPLRQDWKAASEL